MLLICIVAGCVTAKPTKPNVPFAGRPHPAVMDHLLNRNPLLVEELGKLPELQDGISESELQALKYLAGLYHSDSDVFDQAFNKMYQVGLPDIRKYCSPLQALFWIVLRDPEQAKQLIGSYRLTDMMVNAWNYGDKDRWGNPEQVIDRLNAPELFELWFGINFVYDWGKLPIKDAHASLQTAEQSIKSRTGVCTDAAFLACHCLTKAGYETMALRAYFFKDSSRHPLGGFVGHTVCVVHVEGALYIKGDTHLLERTGRSFGTYREIAEYIARCHGVPLDGYLTGMDAYYRLRW